MSDSSFGRLPVFWKMTASVLFGAIAVRIHQRGDLDVLDRQHLTDVGRTA
jgi:hypothetical protein